MGDEDSRKKGRPITGTFRTGQEGREGFPETFAGLEELSPELYAGSSMVNAGVNNYVLSRSGLTFEGIQGTGHRSERALYAPGTAAGADVGEQVEVRYFQGTSRTPRAVCP